MRSIAKRNPPHILTQSRVSAEQLRLIQPRLTRPLRPRSFPDRIPQLLQRGRIMRIHFAMLRWSLLSFSGNDGADLVAYY